MESKYIISYFILQTNQKLERRQFQSWDIPILFLSCVIRKSLQSIDILYISVSMEIVVIIAGKDQPQYTCIIACTVLFNNLVQ